MSKPDEAKKEIQLALDNGWQVDVRFTYRPFKLAVRSAIRRALIEGRWGSIYEVAELHMRAQASFDAVRAHFSSDPNFSAEVIVNAGTPEAPADPMEIPADSLADGSDLRYTDIEDLKKIVDEAIREFAKDDTYPRDLLKDLVGDDYGRVSDIPWLGRDSDEAQGSASERGRQDDGGDSVRNGGQATPSVRETQEHNADGLTSSRTAPEGTTFIGKSATGGDLFETPDGVRNILDGDFLLTEPVMVKPTRGGMVMQPAREINRPEFLTPQEYESKGGKPLAAPNETQAPQQNTSTIQVEGNTNESSKLRNRVGDDGEGVPEGDRPEAIPANAEGRSTGGTRNPNGQGGGRTRTTATGAEPRTP